MSSHLSSSKGLASSKAASKSNSKQPSSTMRVSEKVTPSIRPLPPLKSSSFQSPQSASSKSVSVRTSTIITGKQPSTSHISSARNRNVPVSSGRSASITQTAASVKSPSNHVSTSTNRTASVKRTKSTKPSTSQKIETKRNPRSVSNTRVTLSSTAGTKSQASNKHSTATQPSASTKRQSVIIAEPGSPAKRDIVPTNISKSTRKTYSGLCKSVSKSEIPNSKSIIVRDMGSSSKSSPARKQNSASGNPHQLAVVPGPIVIVQRPAVVVLPPPPPTPLVIVRPKVICQRCGRKICGIGAADDRKRSYLDCSTRRDCSSSSSSGC